MFENIGGKIKGLAMCVLFIESFAIIVAATFLALQISIWLGIGVLVVGGLTAIISAWVLYGFGEIIDKLTNMETNMRTLHRM